MNEVIDRYIAPQSFHESWNIEGLQAALKDDFGLDVPLTQWLEQKDDLTEDAIRQRVLTAMEDAYGQKEAQVGPEVMRQFERAVMLQVLDGHWKEHLAAMDQLRQGIHLRGYAQKDPKQEYKRESFEMFERMLQGLLREVMAILSRVEVRAQEDVDALEAERRREANVRQQEIHESASALAESAPPPPPESPRGPPPVVRVGDKVGRNDPCPCGSGRKYKQCHGAIR